jgi:DNA ligase-1
MNSPEHKECEMVFYSRYSIVKTILVCFVFFVFFIFFILSPLLTSASAMPCSDVNSPNVQLAAIYDKQNVQDYLISEKYDGVRAIWKDRTLRTRNGNIIHAPIWFTEKLPDVWLDGELWYQRQNFEYVVSTVNKKVPVDKEWLNITYRVFDAPNYYAEFQSRAIFYTSLIQSLNLRHVIAVEQFRLNTNEGLSAYLENYAAEGAEGLMLQNASAKFTDGRSGNLLKLKPYMDAEARVLSHLEGKGKYRNKVGAILVLYKSTSGKTIRFKIGSGLSDNDRADPPPVGSVITFKYHGFTKRGVPRFASFMRVHTPD